MLRAILRLGLVILVLNQLTAPCDGFRTKGKYDNTGYNGPNPKSLAGTSSGLPAQQTTRRGLGISAWGIVILVVSIIIAGMGIYYFSVCYPMCKGYSTSNRYDKMPKMGPPTTSSWDKDPKYNDKIGLPTLA